MSTLKSYDPATGEVVWEGPVADERAAHAALVHSRAAFPAWATLPLERRIAHVLSFKAALEARREDLARIISRETGKPLWETRSEIASMVAKVDISIAAQAERAGERHNDTPFGQAVLRHRPHGVMAVLGPFNFPGHLPNGHIVPALLAGNTVIFKPSEMTPATGAAMAECWAEAGLPSGVFQVLQGGQDTGEALLAGDIDGLLFTGSATAGAHFRRVFIERPHVILALELGGNNPLIIWDGDVEEAASIVIQSSFVTTGQRCSCTRRLIIPNTAFGRDVVDAVQALSQRLIIGRWNDDPQPYFGPLISPAAAQNAKNRTDALVTQGAKPIRAFEVLDATGPAFVAPAILDVTDIRAPDEEIFSPIVQVTRVDDFSAAVAAANSTRFGLSAGLVSEDDALWSRFTTDIRAGIVNRNRPTTGASGAMPFGGLGDSGNHRPSAYYAADYCAYPMASFEAATTSGNAATITAMLQP